MIDLYKKISIIYGGSGAECARKIDERIKAMHENEFYALRSSIVAKQILGGANIFKLVQQAISSSAICIIILTFDDIDNTRVRQNVLVEIGMALMAVKNLDDCIFLCEKRALPDDFPSDLKSWINPNYFDKNDLDGIAEKVCKEIVANLKCKPYKNILSRKGYIYDYRNVLNDIPPAIFEEKADIQLEHILECWLDHIDSFDFISEKIMYLFERIKFFPDFNTNKKFFDFLDALRAAVKPCEADYEKYDPRFINTVCSLAVAIIDYTALKLRKDVIRCMRHPQADKKFADECGDKFSAMAESIRKFIDKTESRPDIYDYNWLIKILAYEYLALAEMKVLNFRDKYDGGVSATLDHVVYCYEKVIELADDYAGTSDELWRGYAEYDLTRAYEAYYKITGDAAYLCKIKEFSLKSIITRKAWCRSNKFRGVFANALSFEYFLVKKHELEIRYEIKEYDHCTKEDIFGDLAELDGELKEYCDATELGRLYDMKSSIDEFRKLLAE